MERSPKEATPPMPQNPFPEDADDSLDETVCGGCYRPASECECPIMTQDTPTLSK